MDIRRSREYLKLVPGLFSYLGRPPSPVQASDRLRERLATRTARFLRLLEHGVYNSPASPYRKLLLACGFSWGRARDLILERGLEQALADLRDAGVFLEAQELKGSVPIRRPKLHLDVTADDFDNPYRGTGGVGGTSSGTTSAGVRVVYNWAFLAEEAENELVLYDCHGVSDAPTALWYPVHVSIAGIHNLLLDLGRGRAPARWFSQSPERGVRDTAMRWMIAAGARAHGMRAPSPVNAAVNEESQRVALWMRQALRTSGSAVLRTFASSAVRMVQTAEAEGIDLRGGTIFAGGEPLGDGAAALMREAGVRAIPRYISTESGLIAAACPQSAEAGEMHVYGDRVALIPGNDGRSLLLTTLTPHAGKILLNASVGDEGSLSRRPCGCVLGALGLDQFVGGVGSGQKFTQHGMTVEVRELERIVGELVREAGGADCDFQFWDRPGGGALTVALAPALGAVDEERFLSALLARLRESSAAGKVAAPVWQGAGALRIVRAAPRMTGGHKLKRRIKVD